MSGVPVILVGGAFDDAQTKKLAQRVACLACVSMLLIIINVAVSFSSDYIQDILDGDLSALDLSPDEVEALGGIDFGTFIILGFVINILIFACIMFCGYYGAKEMNSGCLIAFCCCNGCCFVLSLCNFLQLLGLAIGGAAGAGTVTCADLEQFGYDVPTCRATIAFGFFLMVLFLANTTFSWQLYQKTQVIVAHAVPVAPVQVATATAQPVAGGDILGEQKA